MANLPEKTVHPVCIRHMKWTPCLVKSDLEFECFTTILADSQKQATRILRDWHNGILSRTDVEEEIFNEFEVEVDWGV